MGFAATPDGMIYVFGGADSGNVTSKGKFEGWMVRGELYLRYTAKWISNLRAAPAQL